jgi:hypothetical protein
LTPTPAAPDDPSTGTARVARADGSEGVAMRLRRSLVLGLTVVLVAASASAGEAQQRLRCGDEVRADVRLTADVVCPAAHPSPALRVTRAGVTLDLGGHAIRTAGDAQRRGVAVTADRVTGATGRSAGSPPASPASTTAVETSTTASGRCSA